MPQYALEPITPHRPDGLSCRYLMPPCEQTNGHAVLVVAFEGEYPNGSLGNGHGHYIAVQTLYGILAFDPSCVVLDFRLLTYRWGNTLLRVFEDIAQYKDAGNSPDDPRFPVVVVTSRLCRDAFLSLVAPAGAAPPSWHADDLDEAITCAVKAADAWLDG